MMFKWNDYVCADAFPYLAQIPDKSVDLVFTSMPDLSQSDFDASAHGIGSYQQFQKNACIEFARIVKDKGFVVLCQTDRRVNAEILCNHVWYINCLTTLGMRVKDEKIVVRNEVGRKDLFHLTYQYLTIFSRKGSWKRSGDFIRDIIVDKQRDVVPGQPTWSYDFCKLVIEALTPESGYVVDPFAAAGPVLYTARKLGRNYWGAEITPSRYNEDFNLFEDADCDSGLFADADIV